MIIQGGHDTTINLIQYFMFSAFQIPVKYVKFGANIYFELHKDDINNNKFIVKYYYDGEMLLEKDYYDFKQRISEVIWSDEKIKEFCFQENKDKERDENDKSSFNKETLNVILIITNSIFFISTVIFAVPFFYYQKKI